MCNKCKDNAIDFSDLDDFDTVGQQPSESDKHSANPLENESVSALPTDKGNYECHKCRGKGKIDIGYYNRRIGKCFACNGRGYFKTSPEQRGKARKAAAQRKEAEAESNWEAFQAAEPVISQWMIDTMSWNNFASSLQDSVRKYGDLTEKQKAAALKSIAKMAEKAKARAKRDQGIADVSGAGFTAVHAGFDKMRASGRKRISLRFGGLVITKAKDSSKNPGCLYIKEDGEYAGKITPEGRVIAYSLSEDGVKRLENIKSDFALAARVYGQETGQCCCCGRELTNKDSIEAGIGPICAEGWGI